MKVYRISGDDYSAVQFREKYQGLLMRDVAKNLLTKEDGELATSYHFEDEENYWDLTVQGEITDEHSYKIGKSTQDYDDSKHEDLIVENEII